jgi:malonate-semialdehyde dehydrogenase (acetylating) / methylmalonate-semialdehyde dehydrogenase
VPPTPWARSPAASRTSSSRAASRNLLKGGYSEQASTGVDVYSIRQPLGVVAGITPFNFPAMVPMWMFANAIACGNTFVLKPSEKDPSASLLLGRAAEAGRPAGRRVQRGPRRQGGGRPAARAPRHRGGQLRRLDAHRPPHLRDRHRNGKRVQALGGAKNHMVVLPDADIDMAADAASRRLRLGRRALHGDLVVVAVGDVADPLVEAIADRIPQDRVGPARPRAEMGPLITGRAPRQGRRLPRHAPRQRAPRSSSTAVTVTPEEGFFLGCPSSTT